MSLPIFIPEDGDAILADLLTDMQSRLGKVIAPADIEMAQISSRAYYRLLMIVAMNGVGRQNLVAYATGAALDDLGELVGVSRLPASPALTTIQFNMVAGQPGILLPAGIRVQSTDQKAVFTTNFDVTVASGATTVTVAATCTTSGTLGNGYDVGKISMLLDPQPFVSSVTNTDATNGGSDVESDDNLRARIKLAPNSFSTAGPKDAYIFFAKSAHPDIVDVAVTNPLDGDGNPIPVHVDIYPLMKGGQLPSTDIINAVQAICNGDKRRPLTDVVNTYAPTKHDYSIEVQLTLYTGAIAGDVLATVNANLAAYKAKGLNKLGRDVIVSQIESLCVVPDKVYDVTVVSPSTNYVAAENVFTNCTSITVTVVGTNGG